MQSNMQKGGRVSEKIGLEDLCLEVFNKIYLLLP